MTLPASGPLAMTDIQTEFGGTNPIGLNEYYAGGGLVPAGTSGTYGAVPSSGALSIQNFYGTSNYIPVYIEELFQTWLYTGNGSTQTITNGIDLAGEGGLVWTKSRSTANSHFLYDTIRGPNNILFSNQASANLSFANTLTSFNTTGFTLGADDSSNVNGNLGVSWTFRKQPKFFDIVTFTASESNNQRIAHNLGSVPGCIIIKSLAVAGSWTIYHRSLGQNSLLQFNTNSTYNSPNLWGTSPPTTTDFGIDAPFVLASGQTYVAYLFAHDAGGFGLTGTDNVISCGSFTPDGSGNATVNLGYEPQLCIVKAASTTSQWHIMDSMRGFDYSGTKILYPNLANAEATGYSTNGFVPTATGFQVNGQLTAGVTYIYIAIRRGPMKTPTSGTSVFSTLNRTGTGTTTSVTGIGLTPDLLFTKNRFNSGLGRWDWQDRLRGPDRNLFSDGTDAEYSNSSNPSLTAFGMDGVTFGNDQWNGYTNYNSSNTYINYFLRRAPGFFDEVCYTGTGSAGRQVTHNLGVPPEFLIVKRRSGSDSWYCYAQPLGNTYDLLLDSTRAASNADDIWYSTSPTSTTFTVRQYDAVNGSGQTYVAYLFASCPGVSKVTNFTGTGALQTINCGFTSGSRFVLIKRTDSTGDWYVWDSSRGLSSSNDPYLLLNSTAAEVTSTNWVDTTSTGFQVTAAAGNNVNINGASYIALAIS